jgi:hypothetical protein
MGNLCNRGTGAMTMWLCLFAIAGMISSGLFIAALAMDAEG